MNTKEYPKVLVISHNSFGLTDNMGRFLHDTFVKWPSDKLRQLFIYDETPTTDLCKDYYRITDFDIINSIIKRKRPGQHIRNEQNKNNGLIINEKHTELYNKGRKRSIWTYFVRNTIWYLGTWKTKELFKWIEEFSPDIIYFASGEYVFLYRLVLNISHKYNIPVFTGIYDDFYFSAKSKGIFSWLKNNEYKIILKKTILYSFQVSYASSVMKSIYDKEFGVSGFIQYKSAKIVTEQEKKCQFPVLSYAGGLSLNRWESIVKIGRTINKLYPNNEVVLNVYSGETDKTIIDKMTKENGICYRGRISAKEVENVIINSNILLIVEAFDNETRDRIRCSLSTKVADYLGSNRCIFAYGPSDVGTMVYLKENECAVVVSDDNELENSLLEIISSENTRRKFAEIAIKVAEMNHSEEAIHQKLKRVLSREII